MGCLFLVVLEVVDELPAALLEVVPHLVYEGPRDHHVHQYPRHQRDQQHLQTDNLYIQTYNGCLKHRDSHQYFSIDT